MESLGDRTCKSRALTHTSRSSLTAGSVMTKSCSWAFLAAATTSSMLTSRMLSPYLMFSAMLQSNRIGSWVTMPILERRKETLTPLDTRPSISCKQTLILIFKFFFFFPPPDEPSHLHLWFNISVDTRRWPRSLQISKRERRWRIWKALPAQLGPFAILAGIPWHRDKRPSWVPHPSFF